MSEAQANLTQAAIDFLQAAQGVTAQATAAQATAPQAAPLPSDPLDRVSTEVPELGNLQPAVSAEELAQLKQQLDQARLLPETIVQLVDLARQVAGVLQQI